MNGRIFFYAFVILIELFLFPPVKVNAQDTASAGGLSAGKAIMIIQKNWKKYTGKVLLLDTVTLRIITYNSKVLIIPRRNIASIIEIGESELTKLNAPIPNTFINRYFLTGNGIPMERGDKFVNINLWGLGVQFGVAKNLSLGISTSWILAPII